MTALEKSLELLTVLAALRKAFFHNAAEDVEVEHFDVG